MASIMFNAAEVQPSSREPVKPGTYEAVIVNSEAQPMKSGIIRNPALSGISDTA